MKKLILLAFAFVVTSHLKAQNSYGKQTYSHQNSECSSGVPCVNNPGFLIAGYNPSGQNMFYLDRTDRNGVFSGAPYEFQKSYQVFGSTSCAATLQPLRKCYGVTAIEQVASGNGYAVAGSTDLGAFFVNLDNAGNIVSQAMYYFPAGWANNITKALITESKVYPNEFYITGSCAGVMYILRVNSAGVLLAAHSCNFIPSYSMIPTAIVESPYGNNDVTIVGVKNNGIDLDGYLYQIDNGLVAFTNGYYYNYFFMSNIGNSSLHSMVPADPANTTNPGFLLGGNTDGGNTGEAWMMKVDPFGTPIWYRAIDGNYAATNYSVMAVAERFSAANSVFECYGASSTPQGIVVYKLDDTGTPMSVSFGVKDEFVYNDGTSTNTRPVAMSFYNNGAAWDEGLHIFGDLDTFGGSHYLVQSYFSGEAGCNNPISTINSVSTNTISWCALSDQPSANLSPCFNFLVQTANDPSYAPVCNPVPGFPAPATNNRPLALGVNEETESTLHVYPTPTNSKLYITGVKPDEKTSVNVTDLNGKKINVDYSTTADNVIELDLEAAGMARGFYFVTVKQQNKIFKSKFYFTKE